LKQYFDITEFIIDPAATVIPIQVVQKIDAFHKPVLHDIRSDLGVPVIISKYSGYRTIDWEKSRGRDGTSQHTFNGKGAVDVRSNKRFEQLLELLIHSAYMRVCYYPCLGHIHCDYASSTKQYFVADRNKEWHFKYYRN